jgi:hypothetical protein
MAKISKYVKVDKNVLLEYIYDSENLVTEPYDILVNSRDRKRTYVASTTSGTGNTVANSLFRIDPVTNKFGKVNPAFYTFLELKNFATGQPITHDVLRLHLPINWTFGEYLGFYVRVFTYDSLNIQQYEISNFYFDMTDVSQQYLMNFTSPALLFQEKLWGKTVQIEIPAVSAISSQLTNNRPSENSINSNLTGGTGISTSSPIFIEFRFIQSIQTINGVTSYQLTTPVTTTIPQTPEFEKLGLMIENSPNGDFFEIYGTYNGTISEFKKFIDDSVFAGNRYYVQYNITMYEQNIRGKTINVTVTENFNETIEYRPIIKYSTTTAIIDVEMRLIDSVDDSYIIRRASYGMLQDEVAKYSLSMMKINVKNVAKPKIYNMKNSISPDLVGVANSMGTIPLQSFKKRPVLRSTTSDTNGSSQTPRFGGSGVVVEQVKVPFPVLVDRYNIIGRSDNAIIDTKNFYGFGKIQILFYPFDNIIRLTIAQGSNTQPELLDLTKFTEIKLVLRNDQTELNFPPFTESGDVNLRDGQLAFKVEQSKYVDIKKLYQTGINIFYITGKNSTTTSVIYTGLFKPYDDRANVTDLNLQAGNIKPTINLDTSAIKETAIVTQRERKDIPNTPKPNQIKDLQNKLGTSINKMTGKGNNSGGGAAL